MKILTI